MNNARPAVAVLLGSVAVTLIMGCGGPTTTPLPASQASTSQIKPPGPLSGPNVIKNQDAGSWSGSGPDTSATPSAWVFTYHGNLTKDISSAFMPFAFNPFCPVSYSSGCNPIVTSNPSNNTTTSTLTGFPFDPNGKGPISEPPVIHAGIAMSGSQNYKTSAALMYGSVAVPSYFINVNSTKLVKKSATWAYAEVYVAASLSPSGPQIVNLWQEIGYVPKGSAQPQFTFENYGKKALYVQSSGIILNLPVPTDPACQKLNPLCPDDYKILGVLNFAGSPPPGFSGSQFIPLQYPPPKVLKPKKL